MVLRVVEEAGLSDVGRQRHMNEDAYVVAPPVFAVADGMGGARAGEVASRIAIEELGRERGSGAGAEERLREAACEANRRIYELAQEDESHAGMGTTLSSVLVGESEISIGHVGDSRVYRLRGEELERLTHDHSLVEEYVRRGELTPEQAEVHPQRAIITRALGPEPEVEVETWTYPARAGDVYLLCSDGLTGMVSEDELAKVLRGRSSLQQAADELVRLANEAGGKDNVTVLVLRLEQEGEAEGERAEDTLSGQATAVGAPPAGAGVGEPGDGAEAGEPGTGEAPGPAEGDPSHTMAMTKEQARQAREREALRREREAEARRAERAAPRASARRVPRPRLRAPRTLGGAVAVLAAALAAAGLYAGSRQLHFVGTNERAQVTLYRGLPYELPLGLDLYETDYESGAPARAICGPRRGEVLDHELRTRGDAADLVRQIEQGKLVC